MLTSYRRVFAHPGAAAFSATGLVARLPISMMTLGIVLLVSALTGSYALAGQVSAAYVVGNALFAVPHGRLADRFGQRRVLRVDTVVFGLASSLTVVAVSADWSLPWPHLLALLAGMSVPQVGTMVRARWAHLLTDDQERHTAFSVEGVADEVVFVTGPALVTLLATSFAPQSGLVVAIVAGTVGSLALAAQRRTEPPPHRPVAGTTRPPMPWLLLVPLALGAVALGSLFGALEVATVALAEDEGTKAVAGLMLAAFSLGSLVAGVVAGATPTRRPPLTRARIGMTVLAVGTVALPLLPGLLLVTVALFLTGLALAPTLISLFSLIEAAVPAARLNEAMGVVQTGVGAGIAPGAWGAGVVADAAGGSTAFWVCTVSAVLAAVSGLAVRTPADTRTSLVG
ncbi:Predicted arabinose efflux permease, MFS family [Nocardioides scoriae]|uniref:Predicted arabinose efflux permease, MFS family n=2 Tax=Nocardioides scoriae TaxID=642780 RepID=A0A1H1Q671_9ACTN|nr:Predicted arabinose efflux permease, MFS family [Nocardioides scoriae]